MRALLSALLAQISLPGLGQEGPDDLRQLLAAFYVLFGGGFFLAVCGHLFKSRALVGTGIALVMVGTAVFMVAVAGRG